MRTVFLCGLLSLLTACANVWHNEQALEPSPAVHPALANGCACRQAAKPEPAPMVLQAPMPMRSFNIEAVHFAIDKAELLPTAMPKLQEILDSIHHLHPQTVVVEGHTDSTAGLDYNQALSIRRAESVKAYLVNAGIDAAIIRIEGHGETQPISSNATKTGRQQNRRVEVTLQ